MKKRLWLAITLVVILAVSLSLPVFADDGKPKIGDKKALSSGDEAKVIGFDARGNTIWQVKIGDPVYVKGTDIPYDCEWYLRGSEWEAGSNDFTVVVKDKKVTVEYEGSKLSWQPDVFVGTSKLATTPSGQQLGFDPINAHYWKNTLQWDYGDITRNLRLIEAMLIEYYTIDSMPVDDILIIPHTTKDLDFVWARPSVAWDADGKSLSLTVGKNGELTLTREAMQDATFPITIDPDSNFVGTSADGYNQITNEDSWNTARTTSTAEWADKTSFIHYVYAYADGGGDYYISRAYFYFDTSALPDDATITDTAFYGYVSTMIDDDNVGLYIVEGMPTYPHNPLVTSDYNYAHYDSFTSNSGYNLSPVENAWNKLNASNADVLKTKVNKTGYTKLCVVERHDYGNESPAADEKNFVGISAYEAGTGCRPYLLVTYSATAPEIQADAASNVAQTTARLNAIVLDDGYEACYIRWGYGTTTHTAANFTLYDTVTGWSTDNYTTGQHPFEDIAGLNSDDDYFYRVQIKNTNSTTTSANEETFTTESSLTPPTSINTYPQQESIKTSWVRGLGASQTLVRYGVSTYPTAINEGTLAYNGTANQYEITGLTSGHTYFISYWGESSGNFSASYSTAVCTTTAFDIEADAGMATPAPFVSWFLETDYTNLSNTEPLYSAVNSMADSFGTPRDNVWFGLFMILVAMVSVGFMRMWGFEAGFIICVLLEGLGTGLHLVPVWMIFGTIMFGVAFWLLNKQGVKSE